MISNRPPGTRFLYAGCSERPQVTDVHTPLQRSRNMAAIKSKNTSPELLVRSCLHRMGYRFSLHRRELPGRPDIVLRSRKKVIFVHGCFWHMHTCRYGCVKPASNASFWHEKRSGNVERDRRNQRELRKAGWGVLTLWECSISDEEKLRDKLAKFLED
jgi:DNA mismatch endonuclease, patch repair protein